MRVSVIIPTFNSAQTIGRCLEALSAGTFQDFEVVVVDDGSHDDTARIVQGFPVRFFPRSHWGQASSLNYGKAQRVLE